MERGLDGVLKALAHSRRSGNSVVALLGQAPAEGWAPLALAQLLKEGWLHWAVLDSNDPRWVKSCVLAGFVPAVYDLAAGALPPDGSGPALLFRRGQRQASVDPSPEREQLVWRRLPPSSVIIDFSGAGVAAPLAQGSCTLFSAGVEDGPPSGRAVHALPDLPPEQLLVSLARGVHVFPPELLRSPMGVVQDCIASLPPLPLAGGEVRLTPAEPLSRLLEDAADLSQGGDGRLEPFDRRRISRRYHVQMALLAGDYDAAAAGLADAEEEGGEADASEVENGKRLLVWCLLEQAAGLCREAGGGVSAESGRCYARAGELFRRVLDLQPENFDAYAQWGAALQAQGEADRDAAPRYFRAAAEKYKAALAVRRDADVCYGWGRVLQRLAEMQVGEAADALFREAAEKYAQALETRPGFHQALWQWGEALLRQASSKRGAEADELYRQAEEKFAAAAGLQPDDGRVINRWGLVLLEQANRALGEQRRQLLDEASRRFRHAERLQPGVAAYDLACLAALRRDEAEARMWLLKAQETGGLPPPQHVLTDPDLDWLRHMPWLTKLLALG